MSGLIFGMGVVLIVLVVFFLVSYNSVGGTACDCFDLVGWVSRDRGIEVGASLIEIFNKFNKNKRPIA